MARAPWQPCLCEKAPEFCLPNPGRSGKCHESLVSSYRAASCSVCFVLPLQMKQLGVPQGSLAVLILSPTRELAMQIATEAEQIGHFQRLSVQVRSYLHCTMQS